MNPPEPPLRTGLDILKKYIVWVVRENVSMYTHSFQPMKLLLLCGMCFPHVSYRMMASPGHKINVLQNISFMSLYLCGDSV